MKIPVRLVAICVTPLYRLWCKTLRYAEEGREALDRLDAAKRSMIFALWHNELFPLMHVKRQLDIVCPVSRSRDGDYLAALLRGLGLKTARGSSSRGGLAVLRSTLRMMREQPGLHACITVDGPRGPRHMPKPGAVYLAGETGALIVPIRMLMARAKIFRSWDRFEVPLPFSRVHIVYGEPYPIGAEELGEAAVAAHCENLRQKLNSLGEKRE